LFKSQFARDCDKYNTGIDIISVSVTKPKIPEAIRESFEKVETEKTRLMVSTHTQKVIEKEAETERKRATIEALKVAEVSKINMEKEVAIKLANQKIQEIEDQMKSDSVKMQSDSEYYKLTREAEANKLRLTPEFLQYHLTKSLLTNTKIYFGEKIPNIWNGDEWKKMINGTIKA
jgi:regulator of protease activity HflC (stomatin/prohibitin superfamily)